MTKPSEVRKPRLRERREARAARSAARQHQHIAERLAEAQTPLDLLARSYEILRGRLVQAERKAAASVEQAVTPGQQTRAGERLAAVRAEIERVCGAAADEMARLTDQIHTERR